MASLAEIRAKLKSQEVNRSTYQQAETTPSTHTGIYQKAQKQLLGSYQIRIQTTRFSGLKET